MIRLVGSVLAALLLAGCMSQQPVPSVDRSGVAQSRAAATAQAAGPGYYTVKRGDTLYRIALEHGQDYREVAAWNNMSTLATIREGQVLRIVPPGAPEPADGVKASPVAIGGGIETRSLDSSAPVSVATPGDGVKREPRAGKEPYSDEAYARLNNPAAARSEMKPEAAPAPAPAPAPPAPASAATSGPDDVPWMWPTSARVAAPYSESGNKGLDFSGKAGDPVLAAGDGKVVYSGNGLRGFGELVIVKHNATYLSAYAHNRKILVKEGQQVSRGQKIAEMGNTDADSVKLHFEIRKQGKPVDPSLYLPKR